MAPTPKPVHPLVAVFAAVLATLCFTTSSTVHSGFRWVLMAVGFVLLAAAIAGIAATKRGAPESGWLPSRDKDEQ
jgi:protein-S-isoprenylcysteine O-methyltransferase Ste14